MGTGVTVNLSKQGVVNSAPGIADLAYATFENFNRDKVAQTQKYVAHPGVRRLLLKAESMSGGPKRSDVRLRETNTAKFVTPFEITPNIRRDVMGRIYDEMKHVEASYIFDDKEEAFTSGDETRIYDHLKQQFNSTITDKWDFAEQAIWSAPLNSSDTQSVVGIRFQLCGLANNTESDGSFNGGTGRYGNGTSTETTIQGANLADADNARLLRYAATYSGNIDEALFSILSKAKLNTRFQFVSGLKQTLGDASASAAKYTTGGAALYVPSKQFVAFNQYANKKISESSDSEVNSMFAELMVNGMVIVHTPFLDNFTDEPMYAINTEELFAKKLTDRMFKWLPPFRYGTEQWKLACVSSFLMHTQNPRTAGFVIHKKFAA